METFTVCTKVLFVHCSCNTKRVPYTCIALSNGDAGDTDSSQETVELFGSIKKKRSGMLFTIGCAIYGTVRTYM